jgi:glycerate dehydrogenase
MPIYTYHTTLSFSHQGILKSAMIQCKINIKKRGAKMKIVVLDGYTLNPGDLDWSGLERLGDVKVYERTSVEDIISRAEDAEIVLTNKTPLAANALARLPKLRYIGVLATGFNIVDIDAARERSILVTNVPAYGTQSVAQFVFALILELFSSVHVHSAAVHAGEWAASSDFCFTRAPLFELAGKTLGLVGLGRIGSQTAIIAKAFGMKVLVVGSGRTEAPSQEGLEQVTLEEMLVRSDIVSLHCPLTPATEKLINKERIAYMKRSAILVNTSRGGLVDEQDLADALNEGLLAGAALDVLSVEPPKQENPLLTARNCVITPHIAWAAKEARARLLDMAVANLQAYLEGRIENAVNG